MNVLIVLLPNLNQSSIFLYFAIQGCTALWYAADKGHCAIVHKLLHVEAAVDTRDKVTIKNNF